MDALVPMACQPTEMSGRNWMMRRMLIDAVRKDPDWKGGDYVDAAARGAGRQRVLRHRDDRRLAGVLQGRADAREGRQAARRSTGGAVHRRRQRLPLPVGVLGDYNPAPGLGRIRAAVLAINSADDERNPPELGIMERELRGSRARGSTSFPRSEETRGHGTTGDGALLEGAAGGVPGVGAEALRRLAYRDACGDAPERPRASGPAHPPASATTAER